MNVQSPKPKECGGGRSAKMPNSWVKTWNFNKKGENVNENAHECADLKQTHTDIHLWLPDAQF